MSEVRVGQIWREVDPRVNRHVEVVEISSDKARIRAVGENGGNGRWARLDRFNGKRSGYELLEDN